MRTIKFKGKCISPEFKGKTACGSLLTFPDGTARRFMTATSSPTMAEKIEHQKRIAYESKISKEDN